jgi:hypothetical protein
MSSQSKRVDKDGSGSLPANIPPKPKRPLTRYNLFSKLKRGYILLEHHKNSSTAMESTAPKKSEVAGEDPYLGIRPQKYRDVVLSADWFKVGKNKTNRKDYEKHGVISFKGLSETTRDEWNSADEETKRFCSIIYEDELKLYQEEMAAYEKRYGKDAILAQKRKYKKHKVVGTKNAAMPIDSEVDAATSHNIRLQDTIKCAPSVMPAAYTDIRSSGLKTQDTTGMASAGSNLVHQVKNRATSGSQTMMRTTYTDNQSSFLNSQGMASKSSNYAPATLAQIQNSAKPGPQATMPAACTDNQSIGSKPQDMAGMSSNYAPASNLGHQLQTRATAGNWAMVPAACMDNRNSGLNSQDMASMSSNFAPASNLGHQLQNRDTAGYWAMMPAACNDNHSSGLKPQDMAGMSSNYAAAFHLGHQLQNSAKPGPQARMPAAYTDNQSIVLRSQDSAGVSSNFAAASNLGHQLQNRDTAGSQRIMPGGGRSHSEDMTELYKNYDAACQRFAAASQTLGNEYFNEGTESYGCFTQDNSSAGSFQSQSNPPHNSFTSPQWTRNSVGGGAQMDQFQSGLTFGSGLNAPSPVSVSIGSNRMGENPGLVFGSRTYTNSLNNTTASEYTTDHQLSLLQHGRRPQSQMPSRGLEYSMTATQPCAIEEPSARSAFSWIDHQVQVGLRPTAPYLARQSSSQAPIQEQPVLTAPPQLHNIQEPCAMKTTDIDRYEPKPKGSDSEDSGTSITTLLGNDTQHILSGDELMKAFDSEFSKE